MVEIAGRIKLRLRIPESQPPGTYSGVIVNRENGEDSDGTPGRSNCGLITRSGFRTVSGTTSSLVPAILREYGDLTRATLATYLPSREPRRYLYDLLSDYPQRGGKMMRPSMCIAAARLFGAQLEDAINTAVAIESTAA